MNQWGKDMIIINSLKEIKNIDKSVVTIGKFDGIHKGHTVLIEKAVDLAKKENLKSIVFFSFLHIYIMFSHLPMPLPFQLSLPVFPLLILRVLPCRIHPHSQHHGRYI